MLPLPLPQLRCNTIPLCDASVRSAAHSRAVLQRWLTAQGDCPCAAAGRKWRRHSSAPQRRQASFDMPLPGTAIAPRRCGAAAIRQRCAPACSQRQFGRGQRHWPGSGSVVDQVLQCTPLPCRWQAQPAYHCCLPMLRLPRGRCRQPQSWAQRQPLQLAAAQRRITLTRRFSARFSARSAFFRAASSTGISPRGANTYGCRMFTHSR